MFFIRDVYTNAPNCVYLLGIEMKLKKLLFWQDQNQDQNQDQDQGQDKDKDKDKDRDRAITTGAVDDEKLEISQDSLSNVIKLPISTPLSEPVGLQIAAPGNNELNKNLGLFDEVEIQDFFKQNHFGLGRHNGCMFRTQTALEMGKKNIISEFQNILNEQIERKKNKFKKLHLKSIETVGLCDVTQSMLQYAKEVINQDMNLLILQIDLAENGRGWVLKALNAYQIGFGKGVREAVDFDLI